jgi:hypothetical protein
MAEQPLCPKCGGTIHADGCHICAILDAKQPPNGNASAGYPIKSQSLGVGRRQVAAANARNKKAGVQARYDEKGVCHVPTAADRKKLLKVERMHDNQGFD